MLAAKKLNLQAFYFCRKLTITSFSSLEFYQKNLQTINFDVVPVFGHCSMRMFNTRKAIRFGHKLWCLCRLIGLSFFLDIYCRRTSNSPEVSPLENASMHAKIKKCFFRKTGGREHLGKRQSKSNREMLPEEENGLRIERKWRI